MKILFAIKTCYKYRHRADAQRATWVPEVPKEFNGHTIDVRFFLGRGPDSYVPREDEVVFDCGDGYLDLPEKAIKTFFWALEHGYDYLCHIDDDTYARPERLLASGFERFDYVGRLRGSSGIYPAPYCSGFCYWLTRRAMHAVVRAQWNGDTADDRWIGNVLYEAGLKAEIDKRYTVAQYDAAKQPGQKGHCREDQMVGSAVYDSGLSGQADYRYAVVNALVGPDGKTRNTTSLDEPPRKGNDIIAACEFEPVEMLEVHYQFKQLQHKFITHPTYTGPGCAVCGKIETDSRHLQSKLHLLDGSLSKVDLLIKTYLRDGLLLKTIDSVQRNLPDVRMVIVDDGFDTPQKIRLYGELRRIGHTCAWLPRDSGFGAKANLGVHSVDRPYVLIGCDDFNFSPHARTGIEKMVAVLDGVPEIGVVSGRVDGNAYEFLLELGGDWCRARKGYSGEGLVNGVRYFFTDLTVNYCLVRREVFETCRWDDDVKIGGGEHGAWFIKVKRAGWRVAFIPGVSVDQFQPMKFDIHPQYLLHRFRAQNKARPCYDRIGIKHFVDEQGFCEQCGVLCTRVVLKEVV